MGRLVSPVLQALGQAVLRRFVVRHTGEAIGAGSVCIQVYVDDVFLLERAESEEGGESEEHSDGR